MIINMKKFYYLIAMAIMAFTFTSCEDVPAPFGQPVHISGDTEDEGGSTSEYGTADAPLTVAQAIALIDAKSTVAEAYVKGKIYKIDSYNATYHSITYWISDDDGTTTQLQVYSGKGKDGADFAGKEDLTIGQTVTIKGALKNYNGTYEFDKNNEIVSIGDASGGGGSGSDTGSAHGTAEAPLTVAQAIALIDAETTVAEAYVKGKIYKVDSYNATYKSITYWISDDDGTTTQLQVYSGKGLNGADFSAKEDLTVGQTVTVKGALKKYNETYEFDKSNEIVSIGDASGGGTGGDTGSGHGTEAAPLTVAQAIALIDAETTVAEAYVSDDDGTTTQLQVYSGKGLNGADFSAKEDLTVGQTVTVKGALKKYGTTYEFDKSNQIVSIADASGGGGSGSDTGSGHGTEAAPLTVAQAIALIDAETTVAEAYDGGTTTQLQVYSGKGLNGADFSSKEDLTVGKTVVIKGALKKYGSTYEFDKTSSILSID